MLRSPDRRRGNESAAVTFQRKTVFYTVLLVAVLGVTFLLLEIVARVFDPLGVSYYPKTAAYMDTMVVEPPLGYHNRPNLDGTYYGVHVRINSIGLRDREIERQPGESEFRILVLGDSVPFGIAVEYEQSIPYRLEQVLQTELADSGWNFRTINGGTISYNTEQELTQLKGLGLRLGPKLVTLIYAENDIQPKMWIFDKRRAWYVRAVERSYAASLLALVSKKVAGLGPVGRIEGKLVAGDPGWARSKESLEELNGICRQARIPLVVFTFPSLPVVEEVGRREGFPVTSLLELPFWKSEGERPEDYANSATDGHPNPRGSEIYARLMYGALVDLGVLPPPPASRDHGSTGSP